MTPAIPIAIALPVIVRVPIASAIVLVLVAPTVRTTFAVLVPSTTTFVLIGLSIAGVRDLEQGRVRRPRPASLRR